MNITPINYQYQVVRNSNNTNPVIFHGKPQVQAVEKMSEAVTGNSDKMTKKIALFLTGATTAVASLLGIKKTSKQNNVEVASNPNKEIMHVRTIEDVEAENFKTWEELLQKAEEIENIKFDQKKEEAGKVLREVKNRAKAEYDAEISAAENEIDKKRIGLISTRKAYSEYETIKDKAMSEYKAIKDKAMSEYKAIKDKAMSEYKVIKDKAYREYESVRQKALKDKKGSYITTSECETVSLEAFDEYKTIKDKACSEYEDISYKAYSEYKTIKDKAYSEYETIKDKAFSEYEDIKNRNQILDNELHDKKQAALKIYKNKCSAADKEYDNALDSSRQTRRTILAVYTNFLMTRAGNPDTSATVGNSLNSIKQEIESAEKIFEEAGFSNITAKDNTKLKFTHQGIRYEVIKKDSSENADLYKALIKIAEGESDIQDITINAINENKNYDFDWGFGKSAKFTDNLCKLLEKNIGLVDNQYYMNLLLNHVNNISDNEMVKFLQQHTILALRTERGKNVLNSLKTTNPQLYIDIMTPEFLYGTSAGNKLLKKYRPKAFDRLEWQQKIREIESKVDEMVDKRMPPSNTLEVIHTDSRLLFEGGYREGYWDYDTAPTGVPIESTKKWVSGHTEDDCYEVSIKYKYNGQIKHVHGQSNSKNGRDLLSPVYERIAVGRKSLRESLLEEEMKKL